MKHLLLISKVEPIIALYEKYLTKLPQFFKENQTKKILHPAIEIALPKFIQAHKYGLRSDRLIKYIQSRMLKNYHPNATKYVYAFRFGGEGFIKVGSAENVNKRLNQIKIDARKRFGKNTIYEYQLLTLPCINERVAEYLEYNIHHELQEFRAESGMEWYESWNQVETRLMWWYMCSMIIYTKGLFK